MGYTSVPIYSVQKRTHSLHVVRDTGGVRYNTQVCPRAPTALFDNMHCISDVSYPYYVVGCVGVTNHGKAFVYENVRV
jgi:hypothetical protein